MAVSAATVAKITSAIANDKNARKVIGTIIGSVIGLLLIPLIAYMGISGNMDSIEIDTNQVQHSIVQNMSAEEKAKLQHIEDVMTGISKECSKRKLKSIVGKKAQAVYACAFMMSRSLIMILFQNLLIALNRQRTATNYLIC